MYILSVNLQDVLQRDNEKGAKMRKIKAWIKKYIFKIKSPSCLFLGYEYEWDMLRERSEEDGK